MVFLFDVAIATYFTDWIAASAETPPREDEDGMQ